jgi:isochorismate hydrolase
MCLVDSCTTNSIFKKTKYFQTLTQRSENILTITGCDATIVGSGRATITFPNGTQLMIEDALLYPDFTHTLISFKDI